MGALPKRKISKRRRDNRRANDFLESNTLVVCKDCGSMKRPHFVCDACGRYNSQQIMNVK